MYKTTLFLLALSCLFCYNLHAQPDLDLSQITTVSQPVDITGCGDGSGRLFLVEKGGNIQIFDLNSFSLLPDPYLDISDLVINSGERGLLGLAFHPSYASNGHFFVNYVDKTTNNVRISRFTANSPSDNTVDPATELNLISLPKNFNNHNGGDLAFGPDGYLYIGLGDGGGSGDPDNRAQNGQDLFGKMLRIDVDNTSGGNNYAIPPDNPFIGTQTPEIFDEIWALGLRNPWRFSFDRGTGDLWIADVGQGDWEELNYQPAGSSGGENYGWRCYEGNHAFNTSGCGPMNSYVGPIFEYDHDPNTGGRSVTGGFVYRGHDAPDLNGWYVMADYISDNFWLVKYVGSNWVIDLQTNIPVVDVAAFGEDDNGELYVASLSGDVYKVSAIPLPVELMDFTGIFKDGQVRLNWATASETNSSHFLVERKTERTQFKPIGTVPAGGESAVKRSYQFIDPYPAAGTNYYRLKIVDRDSTFSYSPIITVQVKEPVDWQLVPNPSTGLVSLRVNTGHHIEFLKFEVQTAQGQIVFSDEIRAPEFPLQKDFNLEHLPAGVYFCCLDVGEKTVFQQLVLR